MAKYVAATIEGFTSYHEERGRIIPGTWDEEKIESSLLVGSEWIDGSYGESFSGYKTGGFLQDRQWPRTSASSNTYPIYIFGVNEIPQILINAVYEAAYREAANPGSLLKDYTPGKYRRVSIDGALSVEYAGFSLASDIQTTFPVIDRILAPLLTSSSSFASFTGSSSRV